MERTYFCIDMKSFYASVECAERNLNPFETNLVVADESRGKGAITLAISPKMKALGCMNRCRLYEIPKNIKYICAMPRMQLYIDYCADIYEIYIHYVSPTDIHQYSIDEAFIDVTNYLSLYKISGKDLAKKLINEIAEKLHIPATAGIGTNLYLAKIALDITAKHSKDHIGYLDEEIFKSTLWNHKPITDFWNIAYGTSKRLEKYYINDMEGIAKCPSDVLYKEFGINAEILIDHAWGRETCTIKDIKEYKSKSKSLSNSQILFSDYDFEKARIVIQEMALALCHRLMKEKYIARTVFVSVGYSKDIYPVTGSSLRMTVSTSVFSLIVEYVLEIFDQTTFRDIPIRRLCIAYTNLADESAEGYDLFTNYDSVQREKRTEQKVLEIKEKYGKNAVLRGIDLQEGATQIIRNGLIGGHNGGV